MLVPPPSVGDHSLADAAALARRVLSSRLGCWDPASDALRGRAPRLHPPHRACSRCSRASPRTRTTRREGGRRRAPADATDAIACTASRLALRSLTDAASTCARATAARSTTARSSPSSTTSTSTSIADTVRPSSSANHIVSASAAIACTWSSRRAWLCMRSSTPGNSVARHFPERIACTSYLISWLPSFCVSDRSPCGVLGDLVVAREQRDLAAVEPPSRHPQPVGRPTIGRPPRSVGTERPRRRSTLVA